MEERCSVNSPRRILSFSKNRWANVSFPDVDHRSTTELGVSGGHGPKLSEVYGFVGSITTVVFTAIFIIWAYAPDHWLHSIGIYYYPSSECERAKPFPDPYLKALQELGISSDHTFVFEDSVSGIKAGMAAGMPVVGLATGNPESMLSGAGATMVIRILLIPTCGLL